MIRPLRPEDAPLFAALRQRALVTDPHAFIGSPDDDPVGDEAETRRRLAEGARSGDAFLLGAFAPELAGVLGAWRETRPKLRHKAHLWGFYVAPEQRGRGLGATLLAEALAQLRAMPGVVQVQLGVSARSEGARRLYERSGFVAFGTEPRALRLPEGYLDETHMVLALEEPGP